MNPRFFIAPTVILLLIFLSMFVTYIIELFVSSTESTPKEDIDEIVKRIKAQAGESIADLGSGTGKFLLAVTKAKDIRGVGFEFSPILAFLSNFYRFIFKIFTKGRYHFTIEVADFLSQDLQSYDILYGYLPQTIVDAFERKANQALKEGTRIYLYKAHFNRIPARAEYKLPSGTILYEY